MFLLKIGQYLGEKNGKLFSYEIKPADSIENLILIIGTSYIAAGHT